MPSLFENMPYEPAGPTVFLCGCRGLLNSLHFQEFIGSHHRTVSLFRKWNQVSPSRVWQQSAIEIHPEGPGRTCFCKCPITSVCRSVVLGGESVVMIALLVGSCK